MKVRLATISLVVLMVVGAAGFLLFPRGGTEGGIQASIDAMCSSDTQHYDSTIVDTIAEPPPASTMTWHIQHIGSDYYAYHERPEGKIEWLKKGPVMYYRAAGSPWKQTQAPDNFIGICSPTSSGTRDSEFTRGQKTYRVVGSEDLNGETVTRYSTAVASTQRSITPPTPVAGEINVVENLWVDHHNFIVKWQRDWATLADNEPFTGRTTGTLSEIGETNVLPAFALPTPAPTPTPPAAPTATPTATPFADTAKARAERITRTNMDISWNTPPARYSSYRVRHRQQSTETWTTGGRGTARPGAWASARTSVTVRSLNCGTTYEFVVEYRVGSSWSNYATLTATTRTCPTT